MATSLASRHCQGSSGITLMLWAAPVRKLLASQSASLPAYTSRRELGPALLLPVGVLLKPKGQDFKQEYYISPAVCA